MFILMTIPVALRSKVSICSSSLLGSGSSNPVESMDVRLLCLFCVVQIAVSATSWSLIQENPTGCLCPSMCVSVLLCVI
jgi:hypothetical protein